MNVYSVNQIIWLTSVHSPGPTTYNCQSSWCLQLSNTTAASLWHFRFYKDTIFFGRCDLNASPKTLQYVRPFSVFKKCEGMQHIQVSVSMWTSTAVHTLVWLKERTFTIYKSSVKLILAPHVLAEDLKHFFLWSLSNTTLSFRFLPCRIALCHKAPVKDTANKSGLLEGRKGNE